MSAVRMDRGGTRSEQTARSLRWLTSDQHQGDHLAHYEQPELWASGYLDDPHYRLKVRILQGMIPEDVDTLLDVGCGNGAITNVCASRYRVTAGDRSWTALASVRARSIQLAAEALPLRSGSFDLVMTHQLLEHLPGPIFEGALAEIGRVASRYVLLSVPYRDRLAEQVACCMDCRTKYNVWGHVRSFPAVANVRALFPDFTLRAHAFCGPENEYGSRVALWMRQRVGGGWTLNPRSMCPRCSSRRQFCAGFPRRAIAAIASRLDLILPKTRAFWWLICLFERRDRS